MAYETISVTAMTPHIGGPGGGIVRPTAGCPERSYAALSARRPDVSHVQLTGTWDGGTAVDYTVNAEVGLPMVTGPAGAGFTRQRCAATWPRPPVATGVPRRACGTRSRSARRPWRSRRMVRRLLRWQRLLRRRLSSRLRRLGLRRLGTCVRIRIRRLWQRS